MGYKNIHLLPTSKPSILYSFYSILEDLSYGKTFTIVNEETAKINLHKDLKEYQKKLIEGNWKPENIYITSNEEIKEGDCILIHGHYRYGKHVTKVIKITDTYEVIEGGNHSKKVCQKIILTTDQDLIKNGVQAIDDEFLKWFCLKNGKVDFVEVIAIEDEKN